MKSILTSLVLATMTVSVASCAQTERNAAVAKVAAPVGSQFDQVGRVSLHRGQPCTSQIMFDFRGARSTSSVWLAAPMHESVRLTDAAKHNRRVRISGTWRRGKARGCSYVNVSTVEILKSFF